MGCAPSTPGVAHDAHEGPPFAIPVANAAQEATAPEHARLRAAKEDEGGDLTLFDRLGGETAVQDAVDIFYKKLPNDPKLAPFFEGANIHTLKRHQTNFLTLAFGGRSSYTGRSIASAHSYMIQKQGLGVEHFDAVLVHLVATLEEMGKEAGLVQDVLAVIMPMRSAFEALHE